MVPTTAGRWKRALQLALALLVLTTGTASAAPTAGEVPAQPFLRIETGVHTAAITRLSVSADGRLMATAGADKTIRIWTLPAGALKATLRVPIGPGREGALMAVALSPDGRRLVASGHTGLLWDDRAAIYVFDVETETLLGRIGSLPAGINHLVYSPDGQTLVTAFQRNSVDGSPVGIGFWEAKSGRLLAQDADYGDEVFWAAYDSRGRLATASADGHVRLYDETRRRSAKVKAAGGAKPFSVAFSPDGQQLAVGHLDAGRVDVLSGKDLKPLFSVSTDDLGPGRWPMAVDWAGSGAGLELVAAGQLIDTRNRLLLRRWARGGRGPARDLAIADDTVQQVAGLVGGAVVAAAGDTWRLIDPDHRTVSVARGGETPDFRWLAQGRFGVSGDGSVVDFGISLGGEDPRRFDLTAGALVLDPSADGRTAAPLQTSRRFPASRDQWRGRTAPVIGPVTVRFEDVRERALSLAIQPDDRGFALGTDFTLRLFDTNGHETHRLATPDPVWAVALAANGLVVAGLGDGTLRWYRPGANGSLDERLALFVHRDGRWIAWTPEGFFDHARTGSGGDFVGFLLNNGKAKTPYWLTLAQAYRHFYAPDLVRRKLAGTGDGEIASRLAAIGDLRALLTEQPAPEVALVEVCPLPSDTRAFKRPLQTTVVAEGTAGTGGGTGSPAGAGVRCIPLQQVALTRAFARVRPGGGGGGGAGAGGSAAAAEPGGAAVLLPAGVDAVRLRIRVSDRGGGVGPVDVLLDGRNVGGAGRDPTTRAFARAKPAAGGGPAAPTGSGGPVAPAVSGGPAAAPTGSVSAPVGAASGSATAPPGTRVALIVERDLLLDLDEINELRVHAYRADGRVYQESKAVRFDVTPAPAPTPAAAPAAAATSGPGAGRAGGEAGRPRLHVLAVAINAYEADDAVNRGRLRFAVPDAQAFIEGVRAHSTGLYREVAVTTLFDQAASRAAVEAALTDLAGRIDGGDAVLIYLAGHGVGSEAEIEKFHFITQDVRSVAPAAVKTGALSEDRLIPLLGEISARAGNVFLFLDTCHSGTVTTIATDKMQHELGQYLLTASLSQEEALDGFQGHGLLAAAVLDGLGGRAHRDKASDVISADDLGRYAPARVGELVGTARAAIQRAQFSQRTIGGRSFPIARFVPAGETTPVRAGGPDAVELMFWQSVMHSQNPAELKAYLGRYPNGHFRAIAEARLGEIGCTCR